MTQSYRPIFARLALATCMLLLGACSSLDPVGSTSRSARAEHDSPSLEEIFLEPSLAGHAPRIDSVSPDGRWLLLRWKAGAAERSDQVSRLLEIARPSASGYRGVPLDELVRPIDGEDGKLQRVAWLPDGARLVAQRGTQVVLYDANLGRTAALVVEARSVEEDDDDPHRRYVGSIRRLDVLAQGQFMEVLDNAESYSVELSTELPHEPFLLDDLRHTSADLDAAPIDLFFNDDASIVFGPKDPPRSPEGDEPPAHILHRDENRLVKLDGFDPEVHKNSALSIDGRFLFAFERDRSESPEATIVPDYLTERVSSRSTRRLLAEDGPEPVRAWMWNTSTGARKPFFADDDARSVWLQSRHWAPQATPSLPARFLLVTRSADHRQRDVHIWTEGFLETVFSEHDPAWVGGPLGQVRWQPDGQGLVLGSESFAESTTPGRAQLFHVRADDGRVTQLTSVAGEVSDFRFANDGGLLVTAIRDDAAQKCIGWIDAEALGGDRPLDNGLRWFQQPVGFNASARSGPFESSALFTHERLFAPPEIYVATVDGATQLTRTGTRAFERQNWIKPERITVTASDGVAVRAHVFVPPDWNDGDTSRPTIVFVHGAGYLQNVTEAMTEYPLNLMFHSRLAALGYPVIDIDYRGSAGYGRDFRTAIQFHLGGRDLDDIHDVVDAQIARGLVDAERVGLYGGSYGGFLTMMALFTAPERWAVGCALRSVTDWRTYSPSYTQPRLGRPSTHAEAYARSSPIDHVESLEDPLLVLHGLLDTNVFAQDSIRLIEELIDRGKDFDAMLYPSQGHGFHDGPHWLDEYKRIEGYLLEILGPARRKVLSEDD